MLRITLSKDDYVMVGDDIKLQYESNLRKQSFKLKVTAPEGVAVVKRNVTEDEDNRRVRHS